MTKSLVSCLAACLAVVASTASIASSNVSTLASPWDQPVTAQTSGSNPNCAAAPQLPTQLTLTDYYSDPAHSIIDPVRKKAYDAQMRPLLQALHTVEQMADTYRSTGNVSSAECVAAWLNSFAASNALSQVTSNQDYYVQGWMLGAYAIAWLKVRIAVPASTSPTQITTWFGELADGNKSYYVGPKHGNATDNLNNHRYWAGMASMAAGIATNDLNRYSWGVQSYQTGVDQIAADGTLPLEMARASMALHYHLFAAEPLVVIAEMAEANGTDLYSADGNALQRLVTRSTDGVLDPSYFVQATGLTQNEAGYDPDLLAWVVTYNSRFPAPTLQSIIAQLPSTSAIYLGGQPPVATSP